jgi:uncharacterized protein Usg
LHWQPGVLIDNNMDSLTIHGFVVGLDKRALKGAGKMAQDHSETALMLRGYGLTTAEFFYRMPDYRHVLNSYVWQDYDLAPDYPRLFDFIAFWQAKIEGPLHSVRFVHRRQIGPGSWRNQVGEFRYH